MAQSKIEIRYQNEAREAAKSLEKARRQVELQKEVIALKDMEL